MYWSEGSPINWKFQWKTEWTERNYSREPYSRYFPVRIAGSNWKLNLAGPKHYMPQNAVSFLLSMPWCRLQTASLPGNSCKLYLNVNVTHSVHPCIDMLSMINCTTDLLFYFLLKKIIFMSHLRTYTWWHLIQATFLHAIYFGF